MQFKVKKLAPHAVLPTKAHPTDSGWDLYSAEDHLLNLQCPTLISLGISIELPFGWEAQLRPRSSLSAKGVLAMFGTIDNGYRGDMKVNLIRIAINADRIIRCGDRIAQMVIAPVYQFDMVEVNELTPSDRGEKGFGSSGR